LASEFIFAFIDEFHEQMGLALKKTYLASEIENGFYKYLPYWLIEAYKNLKERNDLPRKNYLDPDVISFLGVEERQGISKSVTNLLQNNTQIPQLPIGNTKLPFGIFVEFLGHLQKSRQALKRPYIQKDFTRLVGKTGWVWSVFSKKDADYNLHTFFEELPKVYQSLVHSNFPFLEEELSLFVKATTIVVLWTVKDEYQGYETGPTYKMFYLISDQDASQRIITDLTDNESKLFASFDFGMTSINFRGKEYKVISYSNGVLDFIYEDTPMLNFIYKILKERLKNYFKN
jgi:hypothetical protein